jgi:inosine-uridine nucleoside N-ribohydrolase/adenylate cyclase class IV
MLIFQKDWDLVEKRIEERGNFDPAEVVRMVSDINRYLPDDWRMTRSTDSFRIQVIKKGSESISLVGHCYLSDEGRTVNIIDTVFLSRWFDQRDVEAIIGNLGDRKIERDFIRQHPYVLTPNLYYFLPPLPDDAASPLYGRQYEKIRMDEERAIPFTDQYHRIHPLTKAGLDLNHYRWIRWTIDGEVREVDYPESGYHGPTYWMLHRLSDEHRRTGLDDYLKTYRQVLQKYDVAPPTAAPQYAPQYEIEYKFLVPPPRYMAEAEFKKIRQKIDDLSFRIISEKKTSQSDEYFDDDAFSLNRVGASFRLRERKDNVRVTLKKRLPHDSTGAPSPAAAREGRYVRIEEEVVVSAAQVADLRAGRPLPVFPYLLISYIAPRHQDIKPVLQVENERTILLIEDPKGGCAEVCLDRVTYDIKGEKVGPFFELELEGKGMNEDALADLAERMERELGLVPSRQSKYERGVSLLKLSQIPQGRKKVIIDTDAGVDDALALIMALKAKELDVLAVTAVSGNVHVDKVVPNLFKVYDALKLKHPPVTAKGEDKTLRVAPIAADSVHGSDGLGDVVSSYTTYPLDSRPAWEVICDLARKYPKEITLITLGPLTNLARAIQEQPEAVGSLKEVVVMGGVFFEIGNVSPDAEFNVKADPDAACEVVTFCRDSCRKIPVDQAGNEVLLPAEPAEADVAKISAYRERPVGDTVPLTFVGLDVTHQVVLRSATLDRAAAAKPAKGLVRFVRDISRKYRDFYYGNEGLPGCYLHDPLTVAYVINPSFLEVQKHIVQVETKGAFTSGVIFPDDRPTRNPLWRNPADEVIGIARRVQREAFEEFMAETILS